MTRHPRAINSGRSPAWAIAVAIAAAFSSACHYSAKGTFPKDVHTIAVPIFANHSQYEGFEFDLTEALTKQVQARTPYKVTAATAADTILQGTIVSVDQQTITLNPLGGVSEEMEMRVTVDFTWKDARTGRTLRERKGFTAVGRFVPTRPIGETLVTGRHEAVDLLADRIIAVMRSDW